MSIKNTIFVAFCLSLTIACDTETPSDDDLAIEDDIEVRSGGFGCTDCTNSPYVNNFDFPELRLNGQPNSDNVSLLGISPPWDADEIIPLIVENNVLYAGEAGMYLEGWTIRLRATYGDVVADFDLEIEDIAFESTWSDDPETSVKYKIDYEMDNDPDDQCESGWITPIQDVRYRRDTITARPDWQSNNWVTLACVGEAAYKAKMLGYTRDTSNRWQRQATLKMLTADYCGDGTPYTVEGTNVYWYDQMYNSDQYPNSLGIEAHWGSGGATCLNHERVSEFQDDIHCSIPACGGRDGSTLTTFQPGEEWISEIWLFGSKTI